MNIRNKNFSILWSIFLISSFGSWFINISGLALLNHLRYSSGFCVGLFMLLRTIPSIIFAPLIGNIVDSFSKKKLLILVEFLRFINVGFFLLSLYLLEKNEEKLLSFILLCLFAFVSSFLYSLFNSIENAIIPEMFEGSNLQQVNSWISTSSNISFIFAPLLSGLLIENKGVLASYSIVLCLYFLSLLICFLLRTNENKIAHTSKSVAHIGESYKTLSIFFKSKQISSDLQMLIISNTTKALFVGIVNASFFFVAKNIFSNKNAPFADIYTSLAIGYILGAFICGKINFGKKLYLYYNIFFGINIFLAIIFVGTSIWNIVLLSIMGIGIFDGLNSIIFNTSIQNYFNKNDLGKIFSSNNALTSMARGIAMALTAILYSFFSYQSVVIIFSLLILVFIIFQQYLIISKKQQIIKD